MPVTIFYSWQGDRPREHHHYLIRNALRGAIARISPSCDCEVDEALRLDHDTNGEPGTPEIAGAVFSKIDRCALFVADLTFVGVTNPADGAVAPEPIPNPNVLLELGYAASRVGWGRIICVMNTAYGAADEQIFDIRHRRWPIRYEVPYRVGVGDSELKEAKKKLEGDLLVAIRSALSDEHERVNSIIASLDVACLLMVGKYAATDRFAAPSGFVLGVPRGELDTPAFNRAVERLLTLGVLRCDVNLAKGAYAYCWTYIGKLVCKKLGR